MLRIIADSTCDISKEDARKMGIQIVPISVRFGNEEFLDGVEITHEEFYTRLAECDELPKTSQPSPDTFMKVFNEAVAAGDDVLGIFISSDLSGTYQSACLAALDVEEETGMYDAKVVVTGGLGRIISNETENVDVYDPDLTLKGINLVYRKQNRKGVK